MKPHRSSLRSTVRRQLTGLLIVAVLLAALPFAAFADDATNTIFLPFIAGGAGAPPIRAEDNVQSVVASGNDTITVGGSTTIYYRIAANSGDGEPGCNATVASPATVTINAPAGVTATPGSRTFTSCDTDQSVVFTASAVGDYEITVSVSDSGAGTYNTNPAKFTLHVEEAGEPADTTAPIVNVSFAAPNGENGWFKTSPVLGSVSASDPSNVTAINCSGATVGAITGQGTASASAPLSVSGEGIHDVSCTATDGAGNNGAASGSSNAATIKIDTIAPAINLNAAANSCTVPGNNGWCRGTQTAGFTASDATSDLANPAQAGFTQSTSTEGSAFNIPSGPVCDVAGNCNPGINAGPFMIDSTAPGINWSGGINDGDSFYFGSVPAAPTCSATDGLSGPGACNVTDHGTTVGSHTLTATAYDVAGNSTTDKRSYTVLAWTLSGFYQPVDMGVLNVAKGGSTVPLKFEVFAGSTELTNTNIVQAFTRKTSCTVGVTTDDIEQYATGGTSLRYDATGGQFIFNWQTPKAAGSCYLVTLTTEDGASIYADFKLK